MGNPKGAGNTLLAVESKGDSVPLAVVSKGGGAALAGGIHRRAASFLAGRIQKKPGFRGTRLCAQSLVCYTFGDRGRGKGVVRKLGQAICPAHRTGGFCVPQGAESACSGVGGAAQWRGGASQ